MSRCITNLFCSLFGHKWRPALNLMKHPRYGALFLCQRCRARTWKQ